MTTPSIVIPRLEIDVIDKNGKMDRNWYKFLALLANSVGPSLTTTDDLQALALDSPPEPNPANPTAKVGLSAVNGSAATFMRSDAAPALDQAITPTWTGVHNFSAVLNANLGLTVSGAAFVSRGITDNALVTSITIGVNRNVSVAAPVLGTTLAIDGGSQSGGANPTVVATGDAAHIASVSIAGNASTPGTNSFDLIHGGSSVATILNRANAALTLGTNNTTQISIAAGGNVSVTQAMGVNGVTPPAQVTGFGTPTGPVVVANFPGATATLVQCSNAIAELIKDLKAFGVYGA